MSTVKIKPSEFRQKVQEGAKRAELAEYYGLPESDIARVLKQLGLKIRKLHTPRFELVEDDEETTEVKEVPEVKAEEVPEPQASEEKEVPVKRTRRTKAQIEAESKGEEVAETTSTEEVAVEEDVEVKAWGAVAAETQTEEATIDISKATENIETSFNIPSGAVASNPLTEQEAINAEAIPAEDNPFLKNWGN